MSSPLLLLIEYRSWVKAQLAEITAAREEASEDQARDLDIEFDIRLKVRRSYCGACRDADVNAACSRIRRNLAVVRRWATPKQLPFLDEAERRFQVLDQKVIEWEARRPKKATPAAPYCPGKVCFPTELDAKIALSKIKEKRHKRPYEERRFYYCEKCKAWHLTHKAKTYRSPR